MTAIEAIDKELARLHEELGSFSLSDYGGEGMFQAYNSVLKEISKVTEILKECALKQVVPSREE